MNFRKSRILMLTGFIIGILIMCIGISFESEKIIAGFLIIGTIIFISTFIQAYIFYTCPHCGYSLLNIRGSMPKHCPECGKILK